MFHDAGDSRFVQGEHEMLRFWRQERVFEQLRTKNSEGPKWSFMDGPITANNPMGVHHAWGRTYKDAFQRFHAMCGHAQRFQNGFDCQGLWVEIEVEKELGLTTKQEVEALGLDRFANACKNRVLRYAARQTEQSIRLGYWMDWDDPDQLRKLAGAVGEDETVEFTTASNEVVSGAAHEIVARLGCPQWGGSYFTFSTENNETIWHFLKKCHEQGKLYRGSDVMPWSGRAGCAYSQMEVADGRKLTVHKALFVRFPIKHRDNEYLLVWTTTPWTLTSNVAVAVNPDLDYARIKSTHDGAIYHLAKENLEHVRLATEFSEGFGRQEWKWPRDVPKLKTLSQIFKEKGGFTLEGVVKGRELIGLEYEGPFDQLPAQQAAGGYPAVFRQVSPDGQVAPSARESHRVIDGGRDSKGSPVVVAGEGTGLVHIAPGCGDIDYRIGQRENIARISPLDEAGVFLEEFGEFTGARAIAPETVELVIGRLRENGFLVYVEQYPHIYPHCWRTGDELVFRLVDEWFLNMDWRDEIAEVVRQINWLPKSIDGQNRELEWLANMGDWMISKKRFWGLALPIWVEEYTVDGEPQLDVEVIGSLAELQERAEDGWDALAGNTPHRPWIDAVKIRNPKTGNLMTRISDVGNPWLDAGIVPFSTMHYNTDREQWKQWYPADLVLECFPGQFRNWFYALLAMATMMDKSPPFKNLLGHRLVMNEEGKPMHKSDGTAIWFEEAAEQIGVDTMRWMFLANPPAVDLRFGTRHREQPITITTPAGPISETPEGAPICKVVSKPAEDVRRRLLIPLWNCYSFFVQYAQLDGFDPRSESVPVAERPEIDRWILSNLQALVTTCRSEFEAFNTAEVCRAATEYIENLSTWYVRRNRRRFWRSHTPGDTDKQSAYHTLYEVLLGLSKLLAPCMPFLCERMYQNLARSFGQDAPVSVHLCDYPQPNADQLDQELNFRMAAAKKVVRLGHRLRDESKMRVRQPLSELRVALLDQSSEAEQELAAIEQLAELIKDELNLKSLSTQASLDEMVRYALKPNLKMLGAKHGKLVGAIRGEIGKLDEAQIQALRSGQAVTLSLDGGTIELESTDVIIESVIDADWQFAEDAGMQVALCTALTPDLQREGMARDFVRNVQQLRKDAGLEIDDRIIVEFASDDADVLLALQQWNDYIRRETLADRVAAGQAAADWTKVKVGNVSLVANIDRVEATAVSSAQPDAGSGTQPSPAGRGK